MIINYFFELTVDIYVSRVTSKLARGNYSNFPRIRCTIVANGMLNNGINERVFRIRFNARVNHNRVNKDKGKERWDRYE